MQIAKGKMVGHSMQFNTGINPSVGITGEETLWDQGGTYTFLTSDTELFVSSTDSGDTSISLFCIGLDGDFNRKTAVVTTDPTDAQDQISIGNWIRFETLLVWGNVEPAGDLYVAPSDTTTGGVPDTTSGIQAKMIAGNNSTRNGFFTIPADHTGFLLSVSANVGKNLDANITAKFRLEDKVFWRRNPFSLFQANVFIPALVRTTIPAKTDVEFVCESSQNMTQVEAQSQYILVNNKYI